MLDGLKQGLQSAIQRILGTAALDEQAIKEFVKDVQRSLLQADVNVRIVLDITSRIEERSLKESPPPGLSRKDHIVKILYEEISSIHGEESKIDLPTDRPSVILLVGIQGSGKTTVAAKLARHFQRKGYRPAIVCSDTYRPGALAQLKTLGQTIGVEVYGEEDSNDPVGLAERGVKYFKGKNRNVVVVDTAGRHKEEKTLLEEMEATARRIKPDLTALVIDGTIGQQCYRQAQAFHGSVPVGGIIVTKLDGAAKGGGALAAAAATGARIFFLGVGERVDDLEVFSPTRFFGRLLGMGDLKALLDRARELETETDEKQVRRMLAGKMTINDFYAQLNQLRKMGSLRKIMEMIPGFESALRDQDLEGMEEKMKKWQFIIQSMTREEKNDPEILSSSRIRRVAKGSGSTEHEVKEMLVRFRQTKQMTKAAKGRGLKEFMRRFSNV